MKSDRWTGENIRRRCDKADVIGDSSNIRQRRGVDIDRDDFLSFNRLVLKNKHLAANYYLLLRAQIRSFEALSSLHLWRSFRAMLLSAHLASSNVEELGICLPYWWWALLFFVVNYVECNGTQQSSASCKQAVQIYQSYIIFNHKQKASSLLQPSTW